MDINAEVEQILKNLSVKAVYSSPTECVELPFVSYYLLEEKGSFYADNEEQISDASVQIDIWTDEGYKCSVISLELNSLMHNAGFYREMMADVPKTEDGVYHRIMKFTKSYVN